MDREELKAVIPEERLVFDSIAPEYLSDTLGRRKGKAEALVFPLSAEEVSGVLKFAHENRIPVTPRGAGTNLVGSTVPTEGGINLDLSRMNRILELDPATMTVTVEPGVLLKDLQAYVEERGLFYPPDPGEKASSIGGNISTNAGGMRTVKYGVTRDYVRGLEIVEADGTILTVGGKNVKDASGLSLKNLYVGSEGTLGVITKCVLKLLPKPEASLSVLVPYPDLDTGIRSVLTILRANANPTAVEFMERKVVQLGEQYSGVSYPHPEAGSYILLTFDGRAEEAAANASRVELLARENGAIDYLLLKDPEKASDIWKVRGALVKASRSRWTLSSPSTRPPLSSISSTSWIGRLGCRWSVSATPGTGTSISASSGETGTRSAGRRNSTKTWIAPTAKPMNWAALPPGSTASASASAATSSGRPIGRTCAP